jgi:hypothetical protein
MPNAMGRPVGRAMARKVTGEPNLECENQRREASKE